MQSEHNQSRYLEPSKAFDAQSWKDYCYSYPNGPHQNLSLEELKTLGLNCVAFSHLLIESLGSSLPAHLRCAEMFFDQEHLELLWGLESIFKGRQIILNEQNLKFGDLFFFGPVEFLEEIENFKNNLQTDDRGDLVCGKFLLHIAVFAGFDRNGKMQFLHANYVDDGVSLWSEDDFYEKKRYQLLYAIKRHKNLDETQLSRIIG